MNDTETVGANVEIDGHGCWNWTGRVVTGYGWAVRPGSAPNMPAHRLSYATFVGPLTPGLVVDHLCENKLCVNPEHLEQVSNSENVKRYHDARRARAAAFA